MMIILDHHNTTRTPKITASLYIKEKPTSTLDKHYSIPEFIFTKG